LFNGTFKIARSVPPQVGESMGSIFHLTPISYFPLFFLTHRYCPKFKKRSKRNNNKKKERRKEKREKQTNQKQNKNKHDNLPMKVNGFVVFWRKSSKVCISFSGEPLCVDISNHGDLSELTLMRILIKLYLAL